MSATSFSELILSATVYGRGQIKATVYKHLSPITLQRIERSIPFSGNVNFFERNFAYILSPVVSGEEKSRKEFAEGSIAFMPAGSALCFFLENTRSYRPMNPLGEISEGMNLLKTLKRGDSIRVDSLSPRES